MFQKAPPPPKHERERVAVVVPLYPRDEPEPPERNALLRAARWVGASTLGTLRWAGDTAHAVFVGHGSLRRVARPLAARALLTRHIFVSGVRALPLVCVVAFGTGTAIVLQTTMAPTPPSAEFGRMLAVVMLRELAPLLTAVLMAGHSATMMAAELGPLELALVRDAGPKLWPRIAATSIASLALAIHFAAVAIIGAFLVSQLVTLRTFDAVREGLQRELAWFDLPLFAGKSLGLGMIVGWFGCHFAIEARSSPSEIARASSRAFVSSLMAGAVYSIGLTVVLYAIIGAPPPP